MADIMTSLHWRVSLSCLSRYSATIITIGDNLLVVLHWRYFSIKLMLWTFLCEFDIKHIYLLVRGLPYLEDLKRLCFDTSSLHIPWEIFLFYLITHWSFCSKSLYYCYRKLISWVLCHSGELLQQVVWCQEYFFKG